MSLLDSIPVELICKILHATIEASSNSSPLSQYPFNVLFTLTHVNRHLRQVALADPSLWSQILLTPEVTLDKVKVLVKRAGTRPLDVRLHTRQRGPPLGWPEKGVFDAILAALPPHRIASIQLHRGILGNTWLTGKVLSRLEECEEGAESIFEELVIDRAVVKVLPCNPRITKSLLHINLNQCIVSFTQFGQYPALRHLHVDTLHGLQGNLYRFLTVSPHLETLSLVTKADDDVGEFKPTLCLELDQLRSLSFTGNDLRLGHSLLRYLDAPQLKDLTLGPSQLSYMVSSSTYPFASNYDGTAGNLISQVQTFRWQAAPVFPPDPRELQLFRSAVRHATNTITCGLCDSSGQSMRALASMLVEYPQGTMPKLQTLELSIPLASLSSVGEILAARGTAGLPKLGCLRLDKLEESNGPKGKDNELTVVKVWVAAQLDVLRKNVKRVEWCGEEIWV